MRKILLAIVICFTLIFAFYNKTEKMVDVPEIVDMKKEVAKEVLKSYGLIPIEVYGFISEGAVMQ